MKKYALPLTAATVLLLATSNAQALPYGINDVYWGAGIAGTANVINNGSAGYSAATPGKSGDVFGTGYDISKMTVEVASSILRVEIFAEIYFNKWLTEQTNIDFPGSLFLSTDGWNPVGSENYLEDGMTAGDGEGWEYAITLDGVWNRENLAGVSGMYSVADGMIENGYAGTRTAQEAWFAPSGDSIATGSWTYGADNKSLIITMSLASLITENIWDPSQDLGLHWTMACANDVIEGKYPGAPIPEPNTLVLFGAGLLGLAGLGRRRSRK